MFSVLLLATRSTGEQDLTGLEPTETQKCPCLSEVEGWSTEPLLRIPSAVIESRLSRTKAKIPISGQVTSLHVTNKSVALSRIKMKAITQTKRDT
jgi:hypothetical protein